MNSREDRTSTVKCTACGGPAYRQMLGGYGARTYFAMQALAMEDVRNGRGQEIEGYLIVMVYICSRCNHIEYYSSRTRPQDE